MTDPGEAQTHLVLRPLLMDHLSDLAEGQSLPVTCNGHRAELSIDTSIGWSARLVLVFDPPHPEWGTRFQTKHFGLEGPGRIAWGHEGAHFQVLLRAETPALEPQSVSPRTSKNN